MIAAPHRGPIPLWLPIWVLVAGFSIFLHGPLPLHSTRTLGVAWEMWHLGQWLLPHHNGLPYSHKAPLLYWLIHAGWAIGGVSDVWPRILQVLLSTANLLLVARLARQLFPQRPQVSRLAPWVLAGLSLYFLFSLQIMFDLLLTAGTLLALVGLTWRDPHAGWTPRWWLLVIGIWLGLLAKGPVALLHIAAPLLLGPLWLDSARTAPARWYGRVAASLLAALALFALWVVPAAVLGGEAYRHELLVTQTAGRIVSAFDHGQPLWWYLAVAPLLLFPWLLWPATWRGLGMRGQLAEPGLRFLLVWLLPTLVAFSLVSGKQAHYLLPELAGFSLWLAGSVAAREQRGERGAQGWLPGVLLLLLGILLIVLPSLVEHGAGDPIFMHAFARAGSGFGLATAALGTLLLLWRAHDAAHAIPRIAVATLLATALWHAQLTASLWPRYDLQPAADQLAALAVQGRQLAYRGRYEGQFNFLGRLTRPIVQIDYDNGPPWAALHPDDIVIDYVHAGQVQVSAPGAPRPLWTGAFRSEQLQIWRAGDWLAARSVIPPR